MHEFGVIEMHCGVVLLILGLCLSTPLGNLSTASVKLSIDLVQWLLTIRYQEGDSQAVDHSSLLVN